MKGDFSRVRFKRDRHYTDVLEQQGRVGLDSDTNEASAIHRYLRTTTNRDVIGACGIPKHGGGFGLSWDASTKELLIAPGRIYVDGILCELEPGDGAGGAVSFTAQPDHPGATLTPVAGQTDLVYLDVWRRHVTAVEDPDLREEALGGPDTTTRLMTVCQVKVMPDVDAGSCSDTIDEWDALIAPSAARLSAEVVPGAADEPCQVGPGGGYRGVENHLYRVEIHDPDDGSTGPTFKWSRDNGSILVSGEFVDSTHVRVSRLGWDDVLALRKNDWVEVLDDESDLRGEPGTLAQITDIGADRLLELGTSLPSTWDATTALRVRRWDQASDALPTGADLPLEDGIEVTFSGSGFRTGDYWMFAARVGGGSSPGVLLDPPVDAPPDGIRHHYCKLALVTWGTDPDGEPGAPTFTVCVPEFPPLTELPSGSTGCCSVTVGDGTHSVGDYATIQDAVDALPDGGRICVLPGDYALAEPVTIETDDIAVVGCGRRARIVGPAGEPAFSAAECERLRFEGLYVQASSSAGAIRVDTCEDVWIHDCVVQNLGGGHTLAADVTVGPGGPGIVVTLGTRASIRGNMVLAAPGISAQGEALEIVENRTWSGGIWIRTGSRRVDVTDNEIDGAGKGVGPGVALGGLSPGEGAPSDAWGVADVRLERNRISGMTGSGITTMADPKGAAAGLDEVDGLVVSHNRITGCALGDPDPSFDHEAVGGIVLRSAAHVLIHGNQVLENGADRAGPSCGIFVYDCEGLEVSDNQVVGNGSPDPDDSSEAFQAGIAAILVTEGPYPPGVAIAADTGAATQAFSVTGLPAAGIRDNVVVSPRGHAVVVVALGPVAVAGNALTSLGPFTQPGLPATAIGSCVFVWNAGLATGVPAATPVGATAGVNVAGAAAASPGLPDGRTLLADNLVTLRTSASDKGGTSMVDLPVRVVASVAVLSGDDIGISGNAVRSSVDGLFYDVFAVGRTVRASHNRMSEIPGTAAASYAGVAGWHVATANQGTHCILPLGTQVIDNDNQVLVSSPLCKQFRDISRGG
jgi:hypothetical protein